MTTDKYASSVAHEIKAIAADEIMKAFKDGKNYTGDNVHAWLADYANRHRREALRLRD